METYRLQEPYRATKLWNEVILAFRTGMPLKRHRRHVRYYNDCFTATECISWLNCYLKNNPNFGPEVTRQQTIQLLQKFLKSHVIKSISSKSKNLQISDNSHLYRFVQYSPQKSVKNSALQTLLRTPLRDINTQDKTGKKSEFTPKHSTLETNKHASLNSKETIFTKNKSFDRIKEHLSECHLVVRTLAIEEIEDMWKTVTLGRLEALLSLSKSDFINSKEISGRLIMHNINRVSKSGVITLIDKTDDIPHWVISAMKCLANWPNASGSGSCLPNYPGFEIDVFKVVRDFFINLGMPLIPSTLYPLITRAFVISGQKSSINSNTSNCSLENSIGLFDAKPCDGLVCSEAVRKQKTKTESVEQKTSTPVLHSSVYLDDSAKSRELSAKNDELHGQSTEGRMILDDPNVMWDYPFTLCYETEFTTVSPVTRIIPTHPSLLSIKGSHTSLHTLNSQTAESVDTVSTISACSHITKNSALHQPDHPVYISNLVQAKKLVYSTDELHCSLNKKDCYDRSNLNMTVKQVSLDDLSNLSDNYETPKCHTISGITTLPRIQKICANTLSESKDFSCIRQLKRENVQRRGEHIKYSLEASRNNSIVYSDSFLELNNSVNSTSQKHSSNHLHPNSFQTAKDNEFSWISCDSKSHVNSPNANDVSDIRKHFIPFGFEQNIKGINNADNVCKIERAIQSKFGECKIDTRDECKKVTSNGSKLLMNCEQCIQLWSFSSNVEEEFTHKICEVLQVLLLLLPPANRRQLHLLFRMINKILRNGKLLLDPTISTKNLLLETFLPAVIYSEDQTQFSKSSVRLIVSFMLEKCEVIFQPPAALKEEVETRLTAMRRGRIKYTWDDSCTLTYCELISQQQYEHQKVSLSKQALIDLLESIIQNEHLSEKEKKKKLKQFKTNHPEVYLERFPNSERKVLPKPKKALLTRFLSLRM